MHAAEANKHGHIDWIILLEKFYSHKWRPGRPVSIRNGDNEFIGIELKVLGESHGGKQGS